MARITWLKDTKIRTRIILLSAVGIVGMCVIAGVGQYLNGSFDKISAIGDLSRSVNEFTMEIMLIEEQFINTNQPELLDRLRKKQEAMGRNSREIAARSTDRKIASSLFHVGKLKFSLPATM
jgi:hypothetical protein